MQTKFRVRVSFGTVESAESVQVWVDSAYDDDPFQRVGTFRAHPKQVAGIMAAFALADDASKNATRHFEFIVSHPRLGEVNGDTYINSIMSGMTTDERGMLHALTNLDMDDTDPN